MSITEWTCEEDGGLTHETVEDAVLSWLEENETDSDTIEVYGYAPVSPKFGKDAAEWFVDTALEQLGEEFGDPYGGDPEPSDAARAAMLRAAERFLREVERGYVTRMCERVQMRTVNLKDYRERRELIRVLTAPEHIAE